MTVFEIPMVSATYDRVRFFCAVNSTSFTAESGRVKATTLVAFGSR